MSKAPLTRDALLGVHAVTLVGSPDGVYGTLYSEKISPEQLRKLADDLDRLQAAVDVFFEIQEYAITYKPTFDTRYNSEDSVIVKASSEQEALLAFDALNLGKAKSVYNRVTQATNQVN
jgi:hypothetical protein